MLILYVNTVREGPVPVRRPYTTRRAHHTTSHERLHNTLLQQLNSHFRSFTACEYEEPQETRNSIHSCLPLLFYIHMRSLSPVWCVSLIHLDGYNYTTIQLYDHTYSPLLFIIILRHSLPSLSCRDTPFLYRYLFK